MSRRWVGGSAGERFLGNKGNKEVHDLDHETEDCQIDEIIRTTHEVAFRTREDAHGQGYSDCPSCLAKAESEEKSC